MVSDREPIRRLDSIEIEMPLSDVRHRVPTDPDHVQRLASSIGQSGQLSPVLLWANGNQIIDGFHRRDAIALLDGEGIRTTIIDATPEEFRDARITSAVTHKGVSFPRVVSWTREVFNETPWSQSIDAAHAFTLEQSARFPKSYRRALRETGFSETDMRELLDWINKKSQTWGLTPQQIGNMLNLADLTSPNIIPMVRERTPGGGHHVLTRAKLKTIVEAIPDHIAQDAIARKAVHEGLQESQVRDLVQSYAHSPTPVTRDELLSTSWLDVAAKRASRRKVIDEQNRLTDEEIARRGDITRINMAAGAINELTQTYPRLKLDQYPEAQQKLNELINQFLVSVASVEGVENIDTLERLTNENIQLRTENTMLNNEIQRLQGRIANLASLLNIRNEIADEQSKIHKDK